MRCELRLQQVREALLEGLDLGAERAHGRDRRRHLAVRHRRRRVVPQPRLDLRLLIDVAVGGEHGGLHELARNRAQKQLGHASAEMTRRYQRRRDRFRVNLTKAAGL